MRFDRIGDTLPLPDTEELSLSFFRYSSLTLEQQDKALALWQRKWDKFVSEMVF